MLNLLDWHCNCPFHDRPLRDRDLAVAQTLLSVPASFSIHQDRQKAPGHMYNGVQTKGRGTKINPSCSFASFVVKVF